MSTESYETTKCRSLAVSGRPLGPDDMDFDLPTGHYGDLDEYLCAVSSSDASDESGQLWIEVCALSARS